MSTPSIARSRRSIVPGQARTRSSWTSKSGRTIGESASRFGRSARRTTAIRCRSATTAAQEIAAAPQPERDLVERLDVALDAVDLAEIGDEHGVDEPGHEGTGVEFAESALVLELLLEVLDRGRAVRRGR